MAIEADAIVFAFEFECEEFGSAFQNFIGAIIGCLKRTASWRTKTSELVDSQDGTRERVI